MGGFSWWGWAEKNGILCRTEMDKGLMMYVRSSNILCIGKTEAEKVKTSGDMEKRTE
jgi:actin-like ATPase involved in cell morphogenesis